MMDKPMVHKVFPRIESARSWAEKGNTGTNKTAYFPYKNMACKIGSHSGIVGRPVIARGEVLPDGRTVEEALKLIPYRGEKS
jgi:hypothetical protein